MQSGHTEVSNCLNSEVPSAGATDARTVIRPLHSVDFSEARNCILPKTAVCATECSFRLAREPVRSTGLATVAANWWAAEPADAVPSIRCRELVALPGGNCSRAMRPGYFPYVP